MDDITLESSIREESKRTIAAIAEKEADAMKRLDEAYQADIESFQKQAEAEADAQIRQERSKLENRAMLERKKLQLLDVENFITRMVKESVQGIRMHEQYRPFLLNAIRGAVGQTQGDVDVLLCPEDLVWEKEILAEIRPPGGDRRMAVKADPTIQWGGCLVVDEAQGRIFNNTLDRIYFRKALLIRRKVEKILADRARNRNTHDPAAGNL